jgi:methanogenic corrinoid protein MtbC1
MMRERLGSVIEAEIIPRLMLAHCVEPVGKPGAVPGSGPEVGDFAVMTMSPDASLAWDSIQRLRAAGWTTEQVYMNLLAPAARHLGDLWSADQADFVDVTIGLSRLQQILHDLSGGTIPDRAPTPEERWAVLAPAPGEKHTFGLSMVGSYFRKAGWAVQLAPGIAQDVLRIVRRQSVAVVGFSLSCETRMDALSAVIRRIRRASRNPSVGILVGGRVFVEKPELAVLIGADASAPDGPTGVLMAQSLLDLRARAC